MAGVIEVPGCPPMSAVSAYFKLGLGMTGINLSLLSELTAHAEVHKMAGFVAGDFNCEPAVVQASGALRQLKGVIFSPGGTCFAASSSSPIDLFVVHGGLQDGVNDVRSISGTCVRTHRPVALRFHPRLVALRMRKLKKPPAIPVDRVCGPVREPADWLPQNSLAEEALKAALSGSRGMALHLLDAAFESFADAAELEVLHATGSHIPVRGLRGREPRFVWA